MKIEWNKVTWYSEVLAIILFVAIFYLGFYLGKEEEKVNDVEITTKDVKNVEVSFENGRQCYVYSHEATKTEPYTVNEFIDMTIDGNLIKGTKKGTQNGPDMTNGYIGSIIGTVDNNTVNDIFSYTIEGSKGKEKEIYKIKEDLTGIEKIRYPLIEQNDILVPDTTKEFKTLFYTRVGCTASN